MRTRKRRGRASPPSEERDELLIPLDALDNGVLLRFESKADPNSPTKLLLLLLDCVDILLLLAHFSVLRHVGFGGEL